MEQEFRSLLQASAAVTAICPRDRIDWGILGQGKAVPAVRLSVIGNTQGRTQQGPDGLWQGRVQADCYGATYAGAKAVADTICALLDGHRSGGFRAIFLDARRDFTETGAADRPHRISLDFLTNWRAG